MTKEFEYMLRLFVNGAIGKKTEQIADISVEKVLALSVEHNIYYSIIHSLILSGLITDCDTKAYYESKLKNLRLATYVKNFRLSEIFRQFEEAGIDHMVLKGFVAASLYHDPYSRISSDTDVLVNRKDEKKAISILVENGFKLVLMSEENAKHSELSHPELGVIEVHISLYNEETSQLWLGKSKKIPSVEEPNFSFSEAEKVYVDDLQFYAQKPGKNVEFLFLHNLTHFIAGGTSIKAMMDFFLAYIRSDGIDYASFNSMVKELHADNFFNGMLSLIERFLPFEGDLVPPFYNPPDDSYADALLEDMETGKWLGYSNEKYLEQRRATFDERAVQLGHPQKSFFKKLFPSSKNLKNNYKYAMEHPILIPVAWVHRIINFGFHKVNSNGQQAEQIGHERIDLLRKFDMMK